MVDSDPESRHGGGAGESPGVGVEAVETDETKGWDDDLVRRDVTGAAYTNLL